MILAHLSIVLMSLFRSAVSDARPELTGGDNLKVQVHHARSANLQPSAGSSSIVAPSHRRVTNESPSALRPSFNRQASRSMANLRQHGDTMIKGVVSQSTAPAQSPSPIHRRISLPDMSSPGARDSIDLDRFLGNPPPPREEEGTECLPAYELTIPILAALLPRKVEFVSPGVQATDRRWKRVWCVLEGTSFKLYEGERGWEKVGGWFGRHSHEKRRKESEPKVVIRGITPEERARQQKYEYEGQQLPRESHRHDRASFSSRQSGYASSSRTSMSRQSSFHEESSRGTNMHLTTSHSDSISSQQSHRALPRALLSVKNRASIGAFHRHTRSEDSPSGLSESNSASHSTHSLALSHEQHQQHQSDSPYQPHSQSSMSSCDCPPPMPSTKNLKDISKVTSRALIRQYTLQNAESGVAIDYHKRPNVIRVRLEGEQFLLQAVNVEQVVEWIEGFQSAADISLDLDERMMPRGPILPRSVFPCKLFRQMGLKFLF
jgi:hypothetical protein